MIGVGGGDGTQFVGFVGHRLLAQHQATGGGEGGNQVKGRLARGPVVAAENRAGLMRFIGVAMRVRQVLAQEIHVCPPVGDRVIVIAIRDGAADHQQQDLSQGMQDAADVVQIIDGGKVLQKRRQAESGRWQIRRGRIGGHWDGSKKQSRIESRPERDVI